MSGWGISHGSAKLRLTCQNPIGPSSWSREGSREFLAFGFKTF